MPLDLLLWQLIRSAGLLSYLLLSASVVAGVTVKTRVLDGVVKRPWVYELHQSLSVAALATITGHVLLVLANAHVRFSLREVLIPFASDWRPLPIALGVLATYLVALLLISTRLRSRIGQKAWRSIHYSSFLAWIFALVHGIDAGSDSALGWVRLLYITTACAIFAMTFYRILLPLPPKEPASAGAEVL